MEAAASRPTARLNTVEEVMERLRIGRSTAFELIGTRQLRSIKVGRRRLVSEAALIEFIARCAQVCPRSPSFEVGNLVCGLRSEVVFFAFKL
jgi:excisionase family DNA binding protein